jgi:thioredoxin reductase (NADPH)
LDNKGYIITNKNTSTTIIPGIFAAGDVQDPKYKQAIVSAGSGCIAAIELEKYISIKT